MNLTNRAIKELSEKIDSLFCSTVTFEQRVKALLVTIAYLHTSALDRDKISFKDARLIFLDLMEKELITAETYIVSNEKEEIEDVRINYKK
jgi:hypothetical protein